MPKKPALLLSLLNLVIKPIAVQTSAPSNQPVVLPQHPPAHDHGAWRAYWNMQGQSWRTEPEIDEKRQKYLAKLRTISPDIEQGIYPFKGTKLNRADVEWLVATHENGRGPIDWSDEGQRKREGIDLRGADLRMVDLHGLPLARMIGNIDVVEGVAITTEQRKTAAVLLQEANLRGAHLEEAILYNVQMQGAFLEGAFLQRAKMRWARLEEVNLRGANLANANLFRSHLEDANLRYAILDGTNLSRAFFDSGTRLTNLGAEKNGAIVSGLHWQNADLTTVNWVQSSRLGDELFAYQQTEKTRRLKAFRRAVRANRQLAVALQDQGLNEQAARFAYRAQELQRRVFWFEMVQQGTKLKQRAQAFGAWLFSWFLHLLAGYGYKLWHSFLSYLIVIIGFTTLYYLLGASFKPPLSLVNALGLSMTSFHGRGFFPGVTQLNDPLTILASIEAFVGLILEATFIATLTQRFFGK